MYDTSVPESTQCTILVHMRALMSQLITLQDCAQLSTVAQHWLQQTVHCICSDVRVAANTKQRIRSSSCDRRGVFETHPVTTTQASCTALATAAATACEPDSFFLASACIIFATYQLPGDCHARAGATWSHSASPLVELQLIPLSRTNSDLLQPV